MKLTQEPTADYRRTEAAANTRAYELIAAQPNLTGGPLAGHPGVNPIATLTPDGYARLMAQLRRERLA